MMTIANQTRPQTRTRRRPAQGSASPVATALSNRFQVIERSPQDLHATPNRVRRPKRAQRERMRANVDRFGPLPILVTPSGEIIDGHAVWQACKDLGRSVPTLVVDWLSEAEIRTFRIALNRLPELSEWDDEVLKAELAFILDADPDLAQFTGFSAAEVDGWLSEPVVDDEEDLTPSGLPLLGQDGDLWQFEGGHRLLQGNAREANSYVTLMAGQLAQAVVSDMPYGCKIAGHASRSHEDFLDGAGLASSEMKAFAAAFLGHVKACLQDGGLTYSFMDGRGLHALMSAAEAIGQTQVALCVWDKVHPGMGSFYRQQAEFILVGKFGDARHVNNVALGSNRRNRSNVWSYPGLASFGRARERALAMHPTVKPVGLISEIILDCTHRGDIVLDPFAGSGTIFLAAQRAKRIAYAMELDPKFIDVAVRRVESATGKPARHAGSGTTYAETMKARAETTPGRDQTTPRIRVRVKDAAEK